jgi:putative hydrolase of the HAD superfamily
MPILFCDLDNTLIDRAAAYRAWAEDYAARLGRDPLEVEWLVSIDHDGMRAREPLFEEVRSRWGIADPVSELVAQYRREYPAFLRPVSPAVVQRLGGLRRSGWVVAIVSNGPPSQRTKVETCGLLPAVDVVVVSEELGVSKPDRRIFEAAARLAGSEIEEGWLVGDNPEADIAAAVEMRIPGIWLRRGRTWTETRWRPFATAEDLEEALSLLPG